MLLCLRCRSYLLRHALLARVDLERMRLCFEVSEVSAAPRVAGARCGDDVDLVLAQRPVRRRGQTLATASESERIIGLRESDLPPLVSRCMSSRNSRIHGESSLVCVGPFSCSAAGVSASASVFGARSWCRAFPAAVVPCMSLDDSPMHDARNSRCTGGLLPRGGRVPKVGFPVRPKICVLSQWWRQG